MKYTDDMPNPKSSDRVISAGRAASDSNQNPFWEILKPLASLRLTIVLFVLALILVFFGTLAQLNEGIWTVVDKYFRSGMVWIPFELIAKFLVTFGKSDLNLNSDMHWSGSFPFPGGWSIGIIMMANLLAAHFMRFRMTWKRAGIFVIHTGFLLLMLSELITGLFAVESTMTLAVGESSNFVDETLSVELAITRPLDDKANEVIKVPGLKLKRRGVISNPELPVDIEVLEYWKNSGMEQQIGPESDDATFQIASGHRFKIYQRSEEAGVDMNQRGDAPSVRVNLRKKGTDESVGTFLLSLWQYPNSTMNSRNFIFPPFKFKIDDKDYTIELRNRREYKPYTIHLLKFEHAKYAGTQIAKDFASTVEVIDSEVPSNREARISMNNPLRYRKDSLYQLQVLRDDSGTVLQVVRNPGRPLPYIACAMVSLGLLMHFSIHLRNFLRRKPPHEGPVERANVSITREYERFLPFLVFATAIIWIVPQAIPPEVSSDKIDYYDVGKIPVLNGGRIKPLDTIARTHLQAISGRSEVQDENKKVVASAVQWYIDVFDAHDALSGKAAEYMIFRIDNDQVLSLLDLKPKPQFYRYSLKEIMPKYRVFETELEKVQAKDSKKLDLRDNRILNLGKKLHLYQQLASGKVPNIIPPQADGEEWLTMDAIDDQVPFTDAEKKKAYDDAAEEIVRLLKEQDMAVETLPPAVFRRVQQMHRALTQRTLSNQAKGLRGRVSPVAAEFTNLMRLGKEGDAKAFNEALRLYKSNDLKRVSDGQKKDIRVEAIFNHFAPFYLCSELYVVTIILACLSWLVWRDPLSHSAFWLCGLTFALHSAAILTRMYIQERPPVTNLYSSAIFIGWGATLFSMILERIYRNGIGIIVAATTGAISMMIGHFLGEEGDTMEMLQAVLDTDFWLATHVTTVTLGYTATFIAGFIAALYVLLGIFTKGVDQKTRKSFAQMIYGIVCFATFLSFTGTVLGGLWADYSWGRFWGWDAKENGAVLVVIWNTLILHARWAGLIKLRGMAVLALVGNMVTFWSWFGTNQLGAGLHAYGFSTELARRCFWVWVGHLSLIAVALLPQKFWRSYADDGHLARKSIEPTNR